MTNALTRPWPPRRIALVVLGVVAYLPALLSAPGRMPADTKLYLYLDPGRLTRLAATTWDPSQFGGWVPHQVTTYLWPSGPWFWFFETIGVPDWIAHRLWIATLLFVGGAGVLRLAQLLGLTVAGAFVAAFVYQVSTYVLPYISRTSLMLLPWAALGWLTILTIRTFRSDGWRYAAMFGLVIATVAQVNPTAFLMIVPGPVAWVALEWAHGRITFGQVRRGSVRLAIVSVAVSFWWISMLLVQGRHGADVLGFSETIEAVSFTATASEVIRGLGYWLFYIRDPYAAATASSLVYQNSSILILIGFTLTACCMFGLVATRWRYRSFAVVLVVAGAVLAVGVHPFDDPSPLMGAINDSRLALALRSSTRALPLLLLGLGLGAGSLTSAVRIRGRNAQAILVAFVLLVALNMPSLWQAKLVDAGLDRDESPPAAWLAAATALDESGTEGRVLQIPGAEFGAFRWGYTVDPPLPFLTDKPVITRDLLPLGSPGVMDLLYALDNRIQAGSLDPRAIAPIARLLGVDELWLTNDQAFDRFRTPRPEVFASELTADIDGLGPPVSYGEPAVNVPDISMVDEQSLTDARIGTPIPPVVLRAVDDAPGTVRLAHEVVIVDGSGDGLVDGAAAGLIDGDEAIFNWVDISGGVNDALLDDLLAGDPLFMVTDSNRDRDEQWRGSQDTVGMTESGGSVRDSFFDGEAHERLQRNRAADAATQTVAFLDDGLVVQASSYGEAFAFLPEARAAAAVDGDPATSWRVGERGSPIGQSITVSSVPDGRLTMLQVQERSSLFMISRIAVESEGVRAEVDLGAESLVGPGQTVELTGDGPVTVTILATEPRPGAPLTGELWVGFAELGPVAQEFVRPPTEVLDRIDGDDDLALVFSRDRVRATNRWRDDPEPNMARQFDVAVSRDGELSATLRLNARASDDALDALATGSSGPVSSDRLAGVPHARASAAFDSDHATFWASPFHTAVGSVLSIPLDPSVPVTSIELVQPGGEWASITAVRVDIGATSVEVPVLPGDAGRSSIPIPTTTADLATIEIVATDGAQTIDRRYGTPTAMPVAIAEIIGLPIKTTPVEARLCRTDLLEIDGSPVGLEVTPDDVRLLLSGAAVTVPTCERATITLASGRHRFVSAPGTATGIDVDLVAWTSVSGGPRQDDGVSDVQTPDVRVAANSVTNWRLESDPCPNGCWLVFGQGFNSGWSASTTAVDGVTSRLDTPVAISGGSNGWWLPPSDTPTVVTVDFGPQRTLRRALIVSTVAVAACLLIVAWPLLRRRRSAPDHSVGSSVAVPVHDDLALGAAPTLAPLLSRAGSQGSRTTTPRTRFLVGSGVLVTLTALLIDPRWSLAAVVVAAAVLATRRPRLVALGGVATVLLVGFLLARRQYLYGYEPGGGWPSISEDLHRVAMFSVMWFTVGVIADDDELVDVDAQTDLLLESTDHG